MTISISASKNLGNQGIQINDQSSRLTNPANPHLEKADEMKSQFAQEMESTFIQHMIEQMRKTVEPSEQESSSISYYNALLDNERAKLMSQNNGGIGLQKLIVNELNKNSLYAKDKI